jgi:hypothetical protein
MEWQTSSFNNRPDCGRSLHDHFVVVFPENDGHCEQRIQMTWGIG